VRSHISSQQNCPCPSQSGHVKNTWYSTSTTGPRLKPRLQFSANKEKQFIKENTLTPVFWGDLEHACITRGTTLESSVRSGGTAAFVRFCHHRCWCPLTAIPPVPNLPRRPQRDAGSGQACPVPRAVVGTPYVIPLHKEQSDNSICTLSPLRAGLI